MRNTILRMLINRMCQLTVRTNFHQKREMLVEKRSTNHVK